MIKECADYSKRCGIRIPQIYNIYEVIDDDNERIYRGPQSIFSIRDYYKNNYCEWLNWMRKKGLKK